MSAKQVWVGLDLGSTVTHICVVDDGGVTLHEQESATTVDDLKDAISAFPVDRIGLIAVEAGGDTHVARGLRGAGFPIAIFEARKASKFLTLRRNKSDASDARGLADLGRLGRNTISQVHLKSPECEQLRSLLVLRQRLVKMRVASENALRARLTMHGLRYKSSRRPGETQDQVERLIAELDPDGGFDPRVDIEPLVDLCEFLRTHLNRLTLDLERRAKSHDVCRRLMEVPGIGPICALSFYSAIEDPGRFEHASDVPTFLGLVPRRYQSGGVSRTRGITKTGSKLTRFHLVTAAMVFGRIAPDGELKQWFDALRTRAGAKRARVALARKLAVILATMWKNGTHFEIKPSPSPGQSGAGPRRCLGALEQPASYVAKGESAAALPTSR